MHPGKGKGAGKLNPLQLALFLFDLQKTKITLGNHSLFSPYHPPKSYPAPNALEALLKINYYLKPKH